MTKNALQIQINLCKNIIKKIERGQRQGNISYWKNRLKSYEKRLG